MPVADVSMLAGVSMQFSFIMHAKNGPIKL